MGKMKIFTFPDMVLAKKAAPIPHVEKDHRKLADDMLETMYDAPGIGLAANQVGVLERIIVLDTEYDPPDEDEEGEDSTRIAHRKPKILINPEIVHREGSILFNEACLSVPEYNADVKRAEKIQLEYRDQDGVTRKLSAEGLLAIAIQHEIDHLDGKLFIDRLSPIKKEFVRKKLRQERKDRDELDPLLAILPKKSKGPRTRGI